MLIFVLLPFVPQVPSCMSANAAKYGHVVDVTSGKGIPDVAVIHATILYAGSSYAGGVALTRTIAYTDKNGDYWIPSAWLKAPADLPFRAPGANAHTEFLITAFKPGFAFVGDDDAWNVYDTFGQPSYLPKSSRVPPHELWLGPVAKIAPLEMKPVELSLRQAAIYYRNILVTGSQPVYRAQHDAGEIALASAANDYFRPLVCGLPQETPMDISEAGAFSVMSPNLDFVEHLRRLEPEGFADAYMHPVFHAKNVCEAMKVHGARQ